ncbi:MAG: hypothetical protein ACKO0M_02650 [Cyanobium sp.]
MSRLRWFAPHHRGIALVLAGGVLLALAQQLVLLRRPPWLLELEAGGPSSGPAALDLRFSRPMRSTSLAAATGLRPQLQHRWLGEGNPLRLLLSPGQRLTQAIQLHLRGRDRRGLPLQPQRWNWDPRPRLLAVVPVRGGEQLQLQGHDGSRRPLTPVLPAIQNVQPLGDGSGVAVVGSRRGDSNGLLHDLWLVPLQQRNLSRAPLREPVIGAPRLLNTEPLIFAHLSSNRHGELLVQSSSPSRPGGSTWLRGRDGGRRPVPQQASGPMQLLPEGGALVVPETEGLSVQALPGRPSRRQLLPGSRDLSGFCPVSGRALLVRHWPDFRRSLELVEPGQPPRQLWLGSEAIHASACDRGGERAWLLLSRWSGQQRSELLSLDRRGRMLQRRVLQGWQVEPGTPLLFDPTSRQLLLTLRPQTSAIQPARPVLIDADSLRLSPQPWPARLALWLPAG